MSEDEKVHQRWHKVTKAIGARLYQHAKASYGVETIPADRMAMMSLVGHPDAKPGEVLEYLEFAFGLRSEDPEMFYGWPEGPCDGVLELFESARGPLQRVLLGLGAQRR